MLKAQCSCGALTAEVEGAQPRVIACHCIACQRRTGTAFGLNAYFPENLVTIRGDAKEFVRDTDLGSKFHTWFCPTCGTTLYWKTSRHPESLGIAVGAFADPDFAAPIRSVWEQSMHRWIKMDCTTQHYPKGVVG